MVVSGIDEWARRLRQLRVERGWRISSGVLFKEIAEDEPEVIESFKEALGVPPLKIRSCHINACLENVPQADEKMVFDHFHTMQHIGKGVDQVRKQENKELLGQGDDRLKRSKYLWLYNAENMVDAARERFDQIKNDNLRTARAWALKESLREM